jgi:hypothetical protein
LLTKLLGFKRVGIEVSIETVDEHNSYVRQGTNTELVLANIVRYRDQCNGTSVTLTLRPAISALTIGYYGTMLQYALQQKLLVKSLLVTRPAFLHVDILPAAIKLQYLTQYKEILQQLGKNTNGLDYNASDPNNYQHMIREQAQACVNLLSTPVPDNLDQLHSQLVAHCRKWDQVYNYNARQLYPELAEIWDRYDY